MVAPDCSATSLSLNRFCLFPRGGVRPQCPVKKYRNGQQNDSVKDRVIRRSGHRRAAVTGHSSTRTEHGASISSADVRVCCVYDRTIDMVAALIIALFDTASLNVTACINIVTGPTNQMFAFFMPRCSFRTNPRDYTRVTSQPVRERKQTASSRNAARIKRWKGYWGLDCNSNTFASDCFASPSSEAVLGRPSA